MEQMKFAVVFAIFATTAVLASPTQEAASAKSPKPAPRLPAPKAPKPAKVPLPNIGSTGSASTGTVAGSNCFWSGTAPFCAGGCGTGYTEEIKDSCGDGACCITGYKAKCCK
ncbi:hypothetical protein B0H34DRAFT_672813 [Crassisporium funariophilum]|nr:hypothetical protein B0H34DRAFT_672813 [Crassisporium funariophilum]